MDEDGLIWQVLYLKSTKTTSKVTSIYCVGKEQMTSYSVRLTKIKEVMNKDCKKTPNE